MARTRTLVVVLLALLLLPSVAASDEAAARRRAPKRYRVTAGRTVAPGLTVRTLRRARGADQVVHVARLSPRSRLQIQPVPSRGNRGRRGPMLERTTKLCRRVDCLLAVNGDFYRSGRTVGGLVMDGRPVRPVRRRWAQATFDNDRRLVTRVVRIRATFLSSDLRRLRTRKVDPRYRRTGLTVYTPARGTKTPRRRAVEAVFRLPKRSPAVRMGQSSVMRLIQVRDARGRTRIPDRGLVLSGVGSGARKLRALAARVRAGTVRPDILVRLDTSPDVWDSVGGRPVLVRDGRSVVRRTKDSFARARHPRTIVGRARDGSTLLVVIDGRTRGRSGMSLADAARLMIKLGAVEALNLDGGGSSSFVVRGKLRNRPSDGRERPVAVALAVVRSSRGRSAPATPRLAPLSEPAPALARSRPSSGQAVPAGAWPAIVATPAGSALPWTGGAAGAIVLLSAARLAIWRSRRR